MVGVTAAALAAGVGGIANREWLAEHAKPSYVPHYVAYFFGSPARYEKIVDAELEKRGRPDLAEVCKTLLETENRLYAPNRVVREPDGSLTYGFGMNEVGLRRLYGDDWRRVLKSKNPIEPVVDEIMRLDSLYQKINGYRGLPREKREKLLAGSFNWGYVEPSLNPYAGPWRRKYLKKFEPVLEARRRTQRARYESAKAMMRYDFPAGKRHQK